MRSALTRELFILACVVAIAGAQRPVRAAGVPPLEYQVKAAFLLNFTKFIEWPESAFASPDSPFNICITGDDPFGNALESIVAGETVGSRRLSIQHMRRPGPKACQLVFAGKSDKELLKSVTAPGAGVLTVGEGSAFLKEGGIIAFVLDNRRVRFDINQTAAANASLRISSQLLNVARSVER